jgi:hypothetical protein
MRFCNESSRCCSSEDSGTAADGFSAAGVLAAGVVAAGFAAEGEFIWPEVTPLWGMLEGGT